MPRKWGEGDSKHLKSSDFQRPDGSYGCQNVVIENVAWETIGQGDDQKETWVLYFVGKTKGLVLNVTNENILADLFGPPQGPANTAADLTAHFSGKHVQIYVDPNVTFGGRRVGGLRLRAASGQATVADSPATHHAEPPPPAEEYAPTAQPDDDIPF